MLSKLAEGELVTTTFERSLGLVGSPNFRDLGGYSTISGRSVRWRTIYRSDAMVRITEEDVGRMAQLGLRTTIDLRTLTEIDNQGISVIHEHGVNRRHHPLISEEHYQALVSSTEDIDLYDLYVHILDEAGPGLKTVFDALTHADGYPIVFHCSLGKDRTGVVSALLLRALGVSDQIIVEDFALSGVYVTPYLERWADAEEQDGRQVNRSILLANADAMERTIDVLNSRYGTGTEYLSHIGVQASQLAILQDTLLE